MGKAGWLHRIMKSSFLTAVVIAALALAVVLVLQIKSGFTVPLTEGKVGYLNLLVDIVVGFFTVWGLYWVASELALKPDLDLVIGNELVGAGSGEPLAGETDALIGQETSPFSRIFEPQVHVALFLENRNPKVARYIRVVLEVRDVPCPKRFERMRSVPHSEVVYARLEGEAMVFQFGEGLAVYKGAGKVYCESVTVVWPQGCYPKRITFVAKLSSSEGDSKERTVSHPIRWIEGAA
jgi:hypothetical protein